MRKVRVFESISVDGYFADAGGGMEWAYATPPDPAFDAWVAGNAGSGGELLFGRVTYEMMAAFWPTPLAARQTVPFAIPVRYDGPDLAAVAVAAGCSAEEVVRRHVAPDYQVAFLGFAPGFAYLTGGDPILALPRRAEPRTLVPAGSVAVAGDYSAVYPRPSPGGWHLIGQTDVVLFDPARSPPSPLAAGMTVRFEVARR